MKKLPLLLLILWLTACSPPPEATPTPTPTPDPLTILQQAGETMQALSSVRFEISRSGGPVYLDEERQMIFSSAVGQYAAPDRVQAVINARAMGMALEVRTIAIGDEQWLTNPLTRQWEKLPAGWGFNPATLFDPALGWEPLMKEDLTNVSPGRQVELEGRSLDYFTATVAGERIRAVTAGLAGDEPVEVSFWIDPQTYRVLQIQFATAGVNGEAAEWLLTFSEFDQPVTIEAPAE